MSEGPAWTTPALRWFRMSYLKRDDEVLPTAVTRLAHYPTEVYVGPHRFTLRYLRVRREGDVLHLDHAGHAWQLRLSTPADAATIHLELDRAITEAEQVWADPNPPAPPPGLDHRGTHEGLVILPVPPFQGVRVGLAAAIGLLLVGVGVPLAAFVGLPSAMVVGGMGLLAALGGAQVFRAVRPQVIEIREGRVRVGTEWFDLRRALLGGGESSLTVREGDRTGSTPLAGPYGCWVRQVIHCAAADLPDETLSAEDEAARAALVQVAQQVRE